MLVVIVCYRAVDLTIDCLGSLAAEVAANPGVHVTVCENGTGDSAIEELRRAITHNGWSDWVSLYLIFPNRGFSGGNNAILRPALAATEVPEYFLLLNADTVVRPGAIGALLAAADQNPRAGVISPRLEWPDGTPQVSCFRDFTPGREFFTAARTGLVDRVFGVHKRAYPLPGGPMEPEWTSFACALLRRETLLQIGVLDDGFYLYFDDPDFCRRARAAGWKILHWPAARVVHLRGRSNPVKSLTAERKRRPVYWYASRARYYAKYYGKLGLWMANLLWWAGRGVSLAREIVRNKSPHTCDRECLDVWTNWRAPLQALDQRCSGNVVE